MSACCEFFFFYQFEVSATGRSLVQKNPTEYGVSECDKKHIEMAKAYYGCRSLSKNTLFKTPLRNLFLFISPIQ